MDLVLIAQIAILTQTTSQLFFGLHRECMHPEWGSQKVFIGVMARILATGATLYTLYYAGAFSRIW